MFSQEPGSGSREGMSRNQREFELEAHIGRDWDEMAGKGRYME